MSISGLFLLLAFLTATLLLIFWPVIASRKEKKFGGEEPALNHLRQLQAERESILTTIRDLDFDYQTGKFNESDYRTQREILIQRGIDLLKQIENERADAIEAAIREARQD